MVRDFSSDCLSELQSYVTANEEKDNRRLGSIIDFCADIMHYHNLDVEDYQNNIQAYHQKVIDKENASSNEINQIFADVASCDKQYGGKINKSVYTLRQINYFLSDLKNIIKVNPGDSDNSGLMVSSITFQNSCALADKPMIAALAEEYYTVNEEGEGVYDWEQIKSTLQKDPKDVSDKEYLALMKVLDTMVHKKEDGTYDLDTKAMEKFINCGYHYEVKKEPGQESLSGGDTTTWSSTAKISDTFKILSGLYKERSNAILTQCGSAYYDNVYSMKDPVESYADKHIQLSNLLSLASENMDTVKYYSVGYNEKKGAEEGAKEWRIDTTISKKDGTYDCYTLGVKEGGIPGKEYSIWNNQVSQTAGDAYGYVSDMSVITYDNINHIAASNKYDWKQKLGQSIGDEAASKIIDKVVKTTEASQGLLQGLGGVYTVCDMYLNSVCIQQTNNHMDELIRQNEWGHYSSALCIGCSVSVSHDSLNVNGAYINTNELQRRLQCYHETAGPNISVNTAVSSIKEFANGKELSKEMVEFVNWSKKNSSYINEYLKDH